MLIKTALLRRMPSLTFITFILYTSAFLSGSAMTFTKEAKRIFYVSNNGNDQYDGGFTSPWETLQHASEKTEPGDLILISNGQYIGFRAKVSGTKDSPIIFKANGNEVYITREYNSEKDDINIDKVNYIVIDGFNVQNAQRAGIRVVDSTGSIIKNNVVSNNQKWGIFTGFAPRVVIMNNRVFNSKEEHGIYVSNSNIKNDDPVIIGNEVYNNHYSGIQLNGDCEMGGYGQISGARIENNIVHDNDMKGISLISVADSFVQNNVIYNNGRISGAGGIHLTDTSDCLRPTQNTIIMNNTISEPRIAAIRLNDGAKNNIIFNNIISSPKGIRDEVENNHIDLDSNVVLKTNKSEFLDPEKGDFHLVKDSRAISFGKKMYQHVIAPKKDLEGYTRDERIDSGAYQYRR